MTTQPSIATVGSKMELMVVQSFDFPTFVHISLSALSGALLAEANAQVLALSADYEAALAANTAALEQLRAGGKARLSWGNGNYQPP